MQSLLTGLPASLARVHAEMVIPICAVVLFYKLAHLMKWDRYEVLGLLSFQIVVYLIASLLLDQGDRRGRVCAVGLRDGPRAHRRSRETGVTRGREEGRGRGEGKKCWTLGNGSRRLDSSPSGGGILPRDVSRGRDDRARALAAALFGGSGVFDGDLFSARRPGLLRTAPDPARRDVALLRRLSASGQQYFAGRNTLCRAVGTGRAGG